MSNEIISVQQPQQSPPTRRAPRPQIAPKQILAFVEQVVGDDMHAKRVLSRASGVVGVIHAAALAVHFIGEGLAAAMGTDPKHAIKQVDRLLSNPAISLSMFFANWVSPRNCARTSSASSSTVSVTARVIASPARARCSPFLSHLLALLAS